MNWTARLAPSVLNKLKSLEVSVPGVVHAVMTRMRAELVADPNTHLGPSAVPVRVRPWYIVLGSTDGLTHNVHLTFFVDVLQKQGLLDIVDCRIDLLSPP